MVSQMSYTIYGTASWGFQLGFAQPYLAWGWDSDSSEFKFKGDSNKQKEKCDQMCFKYLT